VAPVRLAWLKTRSDLVHEVMAWHIARAKLRQAQGMLVAECGFAPHCADLQPHASENTSTRRPEPESSSNVLGEVLMHIPASPQTVYGEGVVPGN
jgi:hypothetical protein